MGLEDERYGAVPADHRFEAGRFRAAGAFYIRNFDAGVGAGEASAERTGRMTGRGSNHFEAP